MFFFFTIFLQITLLLSLDLVFFPLALLGHNPPHLTVFTLLPLKVLMIYMLTNWLQAKPNWLPDRRACISCCFNLSFALNLWCCSDCSSAPLREKAGWDIPRCSAAVHVFLHHTELLWLQLTTQRGGLLSMVLMNAWITFRSDFFDVYQNRRV